MHESDYGDSLLREVAREDAPSLPRPQVGERLGGEDGRRFEILTQLGAGAMGLVFRAHDHELQRVVALKFLVPHGGLGEGPLISLLRQEARAIAQLDHENIVRIFDVSEWNSAQWKAKVPFLVMECLEGESLASLLQRERLGLGHAFGIMAGIVAGLAHAHARHVIHRDLKPSNVFILEDGKVKLLDFGLAHLMARATPVPYLPAAGTPTHMAPEQWRGEVQDERTDVWAAGITFFELLTGTHPYLDANSLELRTRVPSDESVPSLRERSPELPDEVERLVVTALSKDPAKRFPSALELREALRGLEERFAPWHGGPQSVAPQRRQVTVVACRLTGLSEPLDPEDFSELEAAFHHECSKLIHQHGGSVSLCVGDEVLACFGHPVAQEDDSVRAVRAGLCMAASLQELSRQGQQKLAVRVGVHTDLVVLEGLQPEAQGSACSIQGSAPQVAAWLARQAEPNTVLLSDSTHRLVRGAFATERGGARTFEGLSGTTSVGLHRVLHELKTESRFERALAAGGLTPLVNRRRELRLLLDLWAQALRGQGSFLLLTGEAGIGKSRLIRELRERIPPESTTVVRCQCWSQFRNSAFYPVIDRLQHLLKLAPDDPPAQKLGTLERRLGALGLSEGQVRSIASLLSLPVPKDVRSLQQTPERQREKLFEALAFLLHGLAEERPVLLVVEDVHWADPSTLQLFGFLLEYLNGQQCFVLSSARPGFQPPWPQRPGFRRLVLDRLSAEHTAVLVKEASQGSALSEETVEQLVAKTDGVPLFVEEMTRMVVERASPGRIPFSIPVTLHELLLARLDLLPPRRKALAQLCAVVGRGFPHALLLELTGRNEVPLERDLQGLLDSGLLQRQDEADEPGYQFRHALIRDAAYQSLLRSTRRQHHRRIAQVLAERFPERVESRPELLAHHHTEAGDLEPAIGYWMRAGERASQRSAYVEAVEHLTQALRLLRTLPDSPRHKQQELQLLFALGIPLRETRGLGAPEVEQTYARSRELIREVGEALPKLDLASWGFFSYYFARATFQLAREPAEQLVILGERLQNPGLLSMGHRQLATVLFTDGQITPSLRHIEQALKHSNLDIEVQRELAVKHWVAPAVAALAYAAVIRSVFGDPVRAWQSSQEALHLAEQIGHPHTLAHALTYTVMACQLRHEPRRVLELADRDLALSREHRFGLWLEWGTLLRSWAVAELGRPAEGLETLRKGLERWLDAGMRAGMPHFLGLGAEMHLKLGQAQAALASVEEGLGWADRTGEISFKAELHRIEGDCLRMLGREAEARESFFQAINVARQRGAGAFELRATISLGRQLLERGEPRAARRMLERICERFEAGLATPELREAGGLLARARGDDPHPASL